MQKHPPRHSQTTQKNAELTLPFSFVITCHLLRIRLYKLFTFREMCMFRNISPPRVWLRLTETHPHTHTHVCKLHETERKTRSQSRVAPSSRELPATIIRAFTLYLCHVEVMLVEVSNSHLVRGYDFGAVNRIRK